MPENGGCPCVIDCFRVLATDADLPSLILCVLETASVVSRRLTFLEIRKARDRSRYFMPHSQQVDEIVAPFGLVPKRDISAFSSGEKAIASFDSKFCQLKSTNAEKYMSKVQSFPSIIVKWHVIKMIKISNIKLYVMK